MRENLVQYVNLLFAGTPGNDEIRQEILQNTLDRYDDLIAQGKTPEAAYQLAISGIGDINEIFATAGETFTPSSAAVEPIPGTPQETPRRKLRNAISSVSGIFLIALYLFISISTDAWGITWIIFPIWGCLSGLVNAIIDYREANKYD